MSLRRRNRSRHETDPVSCLRGNLPKPSYLAKVATFMASAMQTFPFDYYHASSTVCYAILNKLYYSVVGGIGPQ